MFYNFTNVCLGSTLNLEEVETRSKLSQINLIMVTFGVPNT